MANGYDDVLNKPVSNKVLIFSSLIFAFILKLCCIFYATKSYHDLHVIRRETDMTILDNRARVGGIPLSGVGINYGFPLSWITEYIPEHILYLSTERPFCLINLFSFMFDWIFWLIIASSTVYALSRYREPKYLAGKLLVPLLFSLIFAGIPSLPIWRVEIGIATRTILFVFTCSFLFFILTILPKEIDYWKRKGLRWVP